MTKQRQEKKQPEKKNGQKSELTQTFETQNEFVGITELTDGLTEMSVGDSIQRQAALLADARLHTIQRQIIAKQMGQVRGNRYLQQVATAITAQRAPAPEVGWKGAPTDSANAGETASESGKTLRIPVRNLQVGLKEKAATDMASEDANNEAIVLVPAAIAHSKKEKQSVEVLLHLHGYGIGYRTRKSQLTTTPNSTKGDAVPGGEVGTERDIALDRFAEQIEATGRQVIGILPQGDLTSHFGSKLGGSIDGYVSAVFKAIRELGYFGDNIQPGGIVLTGHSGGGDRIYSMLADGDKSKNEPTNLRELVLFDAIHNSTEVNGIMDWLAGRIEKDLQAMQTAVSSGDEKEQAAWLRNNGFRFRAFHSKNKGYKRRYEQLRKGLEAVFKSNASINALGPQALQVLRDNYNLHEDKPGAWSTGVKFHERLLGDSKGIEKALEALPGGHSSMDVPVPASTKHAVKPSPPLGGSPVTATPDSTAQQVKTKDNKKNLHATQKALTQATLTDEEATLLLDLRKAQDRMKELKHKGKKISEEEKTEKQELEKKLSDGVRVIAKGDIEADLEKSHKTAQEWFAGIVSNATFMDVPIQPSGGAVGGVHQELLARLQIAENNLITLMNNAYPETKAYSTKAQYAKKIGLYSLNGLRPPKPATGGTRPSMHCYGLAVDVNYKGNPFIGNARKVAKTSPQVIENATMLVTEAKMMVTESPGKKNAMQMWDRLHKESEALKTYFSLRKEENRKLLEGFVEKTDGRRSVEDWKRLIEEDYAAVYNEAKGKGKGDFADHSDPSEAGFMDLDKLLVQALTDAGLLWGGQYRGGKDIMHFDWRSGTIKR